MKAIPPWVSYSVYRILLFAVPLAILLLLKVEWVIAAVAAAVIGLCASYILLHRPREKMAKDLYDIRHGVKRPPIVDEDDEDAATDQQEANRRTPPPDDDDGDAAQDDADESELSRLKGERPADQ